MRTKKIIGRTNNKKLSKPKQGLFANLFHNRNKAVGKTNNTVNRRDDNIRIPSVFPGGIPETKTKNPLTKKMICSILKEEIEKINKKMIKENKVGVSAIFLFDMTSLVLDKGKYVSAQSTASASGQGIIYFYIEDITRSFINDRPHLLTDVTAKDFIDITKQFDAIIANQLFSLAIPEKGLVN